MLRGETGGKWKRPTATGSRKPGTPLAWAASVLQQSYDHQTTTSPHNPLYVLHRRYWMPQLHTWQPLSMCCENSVRGRLENSLHQERTCAEWFFSQHILSGCQVCDWVQYTEDCKIRMMQQAEDFWLQPLLVNCVHSRIRCQLHTVNIVITFIIQWTVDHKLLTTYCKHPYHIHHHTMDWLRTKPKV